MDALREAGITRIHMLAKNTKVGSQECWMMIPRRGERILRKEVKLGEQEWKFLETARVAESDRLENGQVCWAKGEKLAVPDQMEGVNEEGSTTSTITTEASRDTPKKEERLVGIGELNELERFKTDILAILGKDRDERQELREMMRNMMAGQLGGSRK